ncbi:hypothetical protein [Planococcus antarcticus]|nr:hypothetical protein [Planococcus antarcticus]
MNNSHFSAVERIETMLTEVSFLKLILVVVPVSMAERYCMRSPVISLLH